MAGLEDKENSAAACNVPSLSVTPNKRDPYAVQIGYSKHGAALESCPSSPSDNEDCKEPNLALHCTPVSLVTYVTDLGDNSAVEALEEQVLALQQQLAALHPVTLVINVGEEEQPSSHAAADQQLQRSEALRQELSKHAGQLKGRIAKLEGALAAGESKIRQQAQELETLKLANKGLHEKLQLNQQQAAHELQEKSERAAQSSAEHTHRIARLQSVLLYDGSERQELQEFASLEYEIKTCQESSLEQQVQQAKQASQQAAAELADIHSRLVEAESSLQQRGAEVEQLQQHLGEVQQALEAASAQGSQWRQRAEKLDQDRQQVEANSRKVNYVRTRLVAHLPQLESTVPDIAKLARELQAWCEKEMQQRMTPR